jgi:type I restriction enzyme S subunit
MDEAMPQHHVRRVRFGDVVQQVKDVVTPAGGGVERYVAGDHMDSDELRVRRWGTVGDGYLGPAFHMRFRPGHVLYGSRRTYLRKLAVADFEGICANTTFVLEPRGHEIRPGFIPCVMLTSAFREHSVKQSRGSVNPYVNFSDLAWFEFPLPSVNRQEQIVDVLGALENTLTEQQNAIEAAALLESSILADLSQNAACSKTTVTELIEAAQYGLSYAPQSSGAYPILRMLNLSEGRVDTNDLKYLDLEPNELARYRVDKGDLLFNRTNSLEHVGRSAVFDQDGDFVFASYLVRVKVKTQRVRPDYLCAWLNSPSGLQQIRRLATKGVSQANVNARSLGSVVVPVPPLLMQDEVMTRLAAVREATLGLRARFDETRQLRSAFVDAAVAEVA